MHLKQLSLILSSEIPSPIYNDSLAISTVRSCKFSLFEARLEDPRKERKATLLAHAEFHQF